MPTSSSEKKSKEWINNKALYIDTENTFRPERIVSIALSRNLDPDKALENIIIAKAYNSAHQELIVEQTGPVIDTNKVKLLIVDSAVAHYRAEFLGRATLSDRQQRLNKFMHMLLRIAETYNVAVLATNQIQSSPDAIFGDAFKPPVAMLWPILALIEYISNVRAKIELLEWLTALITPKEKCSLH